MKIYIAYKLDLFHFASKKGVGSTKNGRDSESKRLGVKLTHNQVVKKGMIIIRQRGTKFHFGKNVKKGKDDTLFSIADGYVKFSNLDKKRKIVSVAKHR